LKDFKQQEFDLIYKLDRKQLKSEDSALLSFPEWYEKEKEDIDLFLFCKYFSPKLYHTYISGEEQSLSEVEDNSPMHKLLRNAEQSEAAPGRGGKLKSFMFPDHIEIFDVVLMSNTRLAAFLKEEGTEFLTS